MAESLSYEALKEMKFADYKKAFKEKSQWKKAKALVVLIDYKLGSRKMPIIIPLRRANQIKPLLKQIKKDKHPNQKMAAGSLGMRRGAKGPELAFKMTHGGYALEAVEGKVAPLVKQFLKCGFVAERGNTTTVEEDKKTLENEEATPNTSEQTPEEQTPEETAEEQAPTVSSADIAQLLKGIKSLALRVRKEVVPTIKQGTFGTVQEDLIGELDTSLEQFQAALGQATPKQQQQLQRHQKFIDNKVRPLLDKVKAAAPKTAPAQVTDTSSSSIDIKQVLKAIKSLAIRIHKEVAPTLKDNSFGAEQKALLNELEDLLQQFDDFYQQATSKQQQQLNKYQNNIDQKIRPLLEKIQAAAKLSSYSVPREEEKAQNMQEHTNSTANTPLEASRKEETTATEGVVEETTLEFNSPEEVDEFLATTKNTIKELLESLSLS
ncbi:MAG: hypothetical protein ACRBFS_03995 [Aureispira sp.]